MGTTRRSFLGTLGATATVGLLTRARVATAAEPFALSAEEAWLWRMIDGVPVGEAFFDDWYLLDAYPPVAGGASLVVAKGLDGKPLRIDVVRRGDPVRAPAATDHLELYAMDGGEGVRLLPKDLMVAMNELAVLLADNDAQGKLASKLLTHQERVAQYPEFMARAAAELAPVAPGEPVKDVVEALKKLQR